MPPQQTGRCGFVSIVGRPNVGKSTLLNALVGRKVAIVTKVPQTTRFSIRGVLTEPRGQVVFMDTPGIHLEKDQLDKRMNSSSLEALHNADCVIHLVDVSREVGTEERMVADRLKAVSAPIILGLNKVDASDKYMDSYIRLWQELKQDKFHDTDSFVLLPLSGKANINLDKLLDLIFERLPEGPPLYPADVVTDTPQRLAIADIIREKLFNASRQELPHSLAVIVENLVPKRRNVLYIAARVIVERDSQKEIVIGKNARLIKKVGTLAREELEASLGQKVFLDLHVKTRKKWRDSPSVLQELGFDMM